MPTHSGNEANGAILSECAAYRYALWRVWNEARPRAVFVMLNPSTADASVDDPTIRKCMGFARRWQCGGIHVVNLFAYRATKPVELQPTKQDVVGADNGRYQWDALFHCTMAMLEAGRPGRGPCVIAWGAASTHRKVLRNAIATRSHLFRQLAERIPVPVQCLGTANDGSPRHPLMLPYATELQPWKAD